MSSPVQSLRSQAVRPLLSIVLGLCATFVFLTWQAPTAHAGTCTFTSTEASNSWHVIANWGCGGVPTSTSPVVIPLGQTVNIKADSPAAAGSVTITGILKPWGSLLSVYGNWTRTGTFTAGTSTVEFVSTATQTVSAETFNNLDNNKTAGTLTALGHIIVSGNLGSGQDGGASTFNLASYNLDVSGTGTIGTGSTVTSTTGTLTFTGDVDNTGNIGSSSGNQLYAALLMNTGSTFSVGSGHTTSTGDFGERGAIAGNSGFLAIAGSFTVKAGGSFDAGSGTVKFFDTSDQNIAGYTFNNLKIDKSAGTVTVVGLSNTINGTLIITGGGATFDTSDLTIVGATTIGSGSTVTSTNMGVFTFTGPVTNAGSLSSLTGTVLFSSTFNNSGTFDVGAGTATSTGSLTNTGTINQEYGKLALLADYSGAGTFNGQAGTTWFYGTADQSIRGVTFYNLEVRKSAGTATIVDADVTLDGVLNLDGAGTLNAGSRALTALHGVSILGSTVTSTTGTLSLAGIANAGFIGSSRGNMLFPSLSFANDAGVLNIGSGTATTTITFPGDGTINGNSGTIVLAGNGGTLMSIWPNGATFNAQSGTVKYARTNGAQAVNCSYIYNNLNIQTVGGDATLSANCTVNGTLKVGGSSTLNAGIRNLSVAGASTILGTATSTSGTLTFTGAVTNSGSIGSVDGNKMFGSTLANSGTLNIGSGVATSTGTLDNSGGTINGDTGRLELVADFVSPAPGTFNAGTGTVRIYGPATQSIRGLAFNNLEVIKSGATVATITDVAATVAGTLTTSGSGTLSSAAKNLTVTGISTIGAGTTVTSTSGSLYFTGAATNNGTIGSGIGNETFVSTLANNGTLQIGGLTLANGTLTNGGTGTINGGGPNGILEVRADFADTGTFNAQSGTFKISSTAAQSIKGEAFKNLEMTKTAETATLTSNATVAGTLTTSAASGSGTLSTTNKTLTVTGASTIGSGTTVTSTSGALAFAGVTNAGSLGTATGPITMTSLGNTGTLSTGGASTSTGAVVNSGTIKLNSEMMNVGGNWTDTGTLTPVTGTVRFYGVNQTINEEDTFYNLKINNTGTATLGGNVTSTGTLTVYAGGKLAVGTYRYAASGATYTNNGLVTIAAGGKIVHALTSSLLTDSTGAHITTNTNPGLVFVTIADADANLNGLVADTITARVTNDAASGADTELMTLVETGVATGIFRNTTFFPLVASGSIVHDNGQFEIGAGGIGSMYYSNVYDTSDTGSDTVTMTLTGSAPGSGSSTGGGGGGGGIPSTVTTYQSSASDADRPKNLANLASQGVNIHALVKLPDDGNVNTQEDSAVYYIGADGKRHAFPNSKVFFTWYADFSGVTVVSAGQLASIPLGKNVRYKPGSRMVKFLSLNDTYVVTSGGILRWVKTEAVASALYGTNWNTMIDDIDDTFFTNYTIGNPINAATDIDLAGVRSSVNTVSDDLHL